MKVPEQAVDVARYLGQAAKSIGLAAFLACSPVVRPPEQPPKPTLTATVELPTPNLDLLFPGISSHPLNTLRRFSLNPPGETTYLYNYSSADLNSESAVITMSFLERISRSLQPFSYDYAGQELTLRFNHQPAATRVFFVVPPEIVLPEQPDQIAYTTFIPEIQTAASYLKVFAPLKSSDDIFRYHSDPNFLFFTLACFQTIGVTIQPVQPSEDLAESLKALFCYGSLSRAFMGRQFDLPYRSYLALANNSPTSVYGQAELRLEVITLSESSYGSIPKVAPIITQPPRQSS